MSVAIAIDPKLSITERRVAMHYFSLMQSYKRSGSLATHIHQQEYYKERIEWAKAGYRRHHTEALKLEARGL